MPWREPPNEPAQPTAAAIRFPNSSSSLGAAVAPSLSFGAEWLG
jgi:hypothetical protein